MVAKLIQQKDRLLEVRTPVGDDVLFLTKLDGIESTSSCFEFYVTLCSKNSSLESTRLNDQPITVTINQDSGSPRFINGVVGQWTKGKRNYQGLQVYHAIIKPKFSRLKLSSNCALFQNKTVPQIFTQVCQANGFHDFDFSQFKGQHKAREYCVQYNESNFDFLNRLLAEEGIYYYFKHSKDKHMMMLSDQSDLVPLLGVKGVYSNVHYDGAHIHHWLPSRKISTNKIASTDYNYQFPTQPLYQESENPDAKITFMNSSKVSRYFFSGHYQDQASGKNIVSHMMEREICQANQIKGTGNYLEFISGLRFKLQKHDDDKKQIGEYFLISVRHKAHDDSHLSQSERKEELSQLYINDFVCLSTKFNFQPEAKCKKPKIKSIHSAVVIGPEGKKPYTDKMGRVKVKFFWDRDQEKKNRSSCWIRVGQTWGGAGRGLQFMPRVGDEVSLSFEDGNPDRPVIHGSLYNGKNDPSYHLPQEQARSGIRTRTIGSDDKSCGHEITFEDFAKQEKFIINATKELKVDAKKIEVVNITQNKKEKIGDNQAINAYKTLTHAAAKEVDMTASKGQVLLKPSEIDIHGAQVSLGKQGKVSMMPVMPGASSVKSVPSEMKTHWIQGKYLDSDGKPMQGMSYTVIHEDGTTKMGKLNGSGQTDRVEKLSDGRATIVFGDQETLEKKLEKQRNQLKSHLDAILKKTQAAAAKERAQFTKEPWVARIFAYNASFGKTIIEGAAIGAERFVVGTAKGVAHLFKDMFELDSITEREKIDEQTGDFKDFAKAQSELSQKVNAMIAPIKKGKALVESLYRDPKTRTILEDFALNYYESETPLMLVKQGSELVGGILPGVVIAAVTGNPELVAPEVIEAVGSDISEVAAVAKQIDETVTELEKCETIENAEVDQEHVATNVKKLEEVRAGNIKAERIKAGSNEKVAVIGRTMGSGEEMGVRDFAAELKNQGYDVEIFDGDVISSSVSKEFNDLIKEKGWLSDDDLQDTQMFSANKLWARKLENEGYTIVDIGNPNNKEMSVFYEIEKQILFKRSVL